MLWALVSSAFVIYLYRKLAAEQNLEAVHGAGSNSMSAIDAEFAKLNERIDGFESRLAKGQAKETAP
jgi:hypothetical protein